MKRFFILALLLTLSACSITKDAENNTESLLEKTIEKDATEAPKPAMLNGKIITPSQNNATIAPNSPKQEKM